MAQQPKNKKEVLYNHLKDRYDLGTFQEFSSNLDDPKQRKAFHDFFSKKFELGDYTSFESEVGGETEEEKQAPRFQAPEVTITPTDEQIKALPGEALQSIAKTLPPPPSIREESFSDPYFESARQRVKEFVKSPYWGTLKAMPIGGGVFRGAETIIKAPSEGKGDVIATGAKAGTGVLEMVLGGAMVGAPGVAAAFETSGALGVDVAAPIKKYATEPVVEHFAKSLSVKAQDAVKELGFVATDLAVFSVLHRLVKAGNNKLADKVATGQKLTVHEEKTVIETAKAITPDEVQLLRGSVDEKAATPVITTQVPVVRGRIAREKLPSVLVNEKGEPIPTQAVREARAPLTTEQGVAFPFEGQPAEIAPTMAKIVSPSGRQVPIREPIRGKIMTEEKLAQKVNEAVRVKLEQPIIPKELEGKVEFQGAQRFKGDKVAFNEFKITDPNSPAVNANISVKPGENLINRVKAKESEFSSKIAAKIGKAGETFRYSGKNVDNTLRELKIPQNEIDIFKVNLAAGGDYAFRDLAHRIYKRLRPNEYARAMEDTEHGKKRNEALKMMENELRESLRKGESSGKLYSLLPLSYLDRQGASVLQGIENNVRGILRRFVPERLQQIFRTPFTATPESQKAWDEFQTTVDRNSSNQNDLVRIITTAMSKENATPLEIEAISRIARGEGFRNPPLSVGIQEAGKQFNEKWHEVAQAATGEMKTLGLPIDEANLAPGEHFYPRVWKDHYARMVSGRLFNFGYKKARVSANELGHVMARKTTRWIVVDESGEVIRNPATKGESIFNTEAEANSFAQQEGGYKLGYIDAKTKQKVYESFPTMKERAQRVEDLSAFGNEIREVPAGGQKLSVLPPMPYEMAIRQGLLEDPIINVTSAQGLSGNLSLIAKTRLYESIGRTSVSDTPQTVEMPDGRKVTFDTKLKDVGFNVPPKLAEANPWIARLRDGYLPRETAQDLAAFIGKNSVGSQIVNMYRGFWKKNVTYRYPFRHVRQVAENELWLGFANSGAFLAPRRFIDFYDGVVNGADVPFYKEAQAAGIFTHTRANAEFIANRDFVNSLMKKYRENPNLSLSERISLWAESNPKARKAAGLDRFVKKLYNAEDDAYRYQLYRYLREKESLNVEDAARQTKESFFYGQEAPRIVQWLSKRIPFTPNVMYYTAKILTTRLINKPASTMLKLALMGYMWNYIRDESHKMAGYSDEDFKKMGNAAPKRYEMILPITDGNGRNLKLNLGWLFVPYDLLIPTGMDFGSWAVRLAPPELKAVVSTITNRTGTGAEIADKGDPKIGEKYLGNLFSQHLPGLFFDYWKRVYDKATAENPNKRKSVARAAIIEPLIGGLQGVDKTTLRTFGEIQHLDRLKFIEKKKYEITAEPKMVTNPDIVRKHNELVRSTLSGISQEYKIPMNEEIIKRYLILPNDVMKSFEKYPMRRALPPLERRAVQ